MFSGGYILGQIKAAQSPVTPESACCLSQEKSIVYILSASHHKGRSRAEHFQFKIHLCLELHKTIGFVEFEAN